jgi:hypothetical protein
MFRVLCVFRVLRLLCVFCVPCVLRALSESQVCSQPQQPAHRNR